VIDGQGAHFPAQPSGDGLRPYLIRFSADEVKALMKGGGSGRVER